MDYYYEKPDFDDIKIEKKLKLKPTNIKKDVKSEKYAGKSVKEKSVTKSDKELKLDVEDSVLTKPKFDFEENVPQMG